MTQPLISVLIPFGDPRGDPRYIKSWTHQTCSPDAFEVIAVTDGMSRELDNQIQANLRATDRLIHSGGNNRFAGYDPGAKAAAAPLLLLTEDHIVADPHCVEEVLRSQRAEEWQAAMLRSGHINETGVGLMEQRLFEEMFERFWSKPDFWDKVRIRGFAVLREHYFAAGGVPGQQYSLFGESLFSARLHKAGVRAVYLPRAVVRHVSLTTFRMLRHEVSEYRQGECAFHEVNKTAELTDYLEPSVDLAQRYARQPQVARSAAYAIGCVGWSAFKSRRFRMLGLLGRELAARTADGLFGSTWRAGCSAISSQIALLRYYFWRFSSARRLEAVRKYWQDISRFAHLWHCATHSRELTPWEVSLGRTLAVTDIPVGSVDGFHSCEQWQDRTFRWTSPVAIVSLRLEPGDYEFHLDTAAVRGATCDFPFGLFFNGSRLAPGDLQINDGCITARIRKMLLCENGVHQLMIVSAPPQREPNAPVDPRPLGMPIHSLHFTPLSQANDLPTGAGRRERVGNFSATGSNAHVAH